MIAYVAIASVAALVPDIDIASSKISKHIGFASKIFQTFGHRTLFHSPLLYLSFYLWAISSVTFLEKWVQVISWGVASHLLLDMLNKKGIPIFFPFPKKFHVLSIKNESVGEWIVDLICVGISGFLIYSMFFGGC